MSAIVFMAGALTGATALAAATFVDWKIRESKFSPALKTPEKLGRDETIRELNTYFFKAQEIYASCNQEMMESAELATTPIELPWDNPLEKAAVFVSGKLTPFCRNQRASRLMDLRDEARGLYSRYRGVFERGRALLAERGIPSAMSPAALEIETKSRPGPSIDNDDWDLELDALADSIRDAIERSCEETESLIAALEDGLATEIA